MKIRKIKLKIKMMKKMVNIGLYPGSTRLLLLMWGWGTAVTTTASCHHIWRNDGWCGTRRLILLFYVVWLWPLALLLSVRLLLTAQRGRVVVDCARPGVVVQGKLAFSVMRVFLAPTATVFVTATATFTARATLLLGRGRFGVLVLFK
jgi:hypothetical protein